jgi:lipid A 3-O-deacylase
MKNLVVSAAFIVLCALVTPSASATEPPPDQHESSWLYAVRAGVLKHDVNRLFSGTNKEPGFDFNGEIIFDRPRFSLLSGNIRPDLGASVNDQGYTSKLYTGLLWEFETESGMFVNTGSGVAVHNGRQETKEPNEISHGSRFLLRIPLEVGYSLNEHYQISIMFDHVCNCSLGHPNEGFDDLGLRFTYRF